MKHLLQFNVDDKWYFDESVYEIGDYAIVRKEGAVWPVNTILTCLDEARNGLPPYFERKGSKEEALQHAEYIEPLWIWNSNIIERYIDREYIIRNDQGIPIPQDILVQLLKYHSGIVNVWLNNYKTVRAASLFHTGESEMYHVNHSTQKSQMYEKVKIEELTKHVINKEYGKQHTTTKVGTTDQQETNVRRTATVIQGDYPSGGSCRVSSTAKIRI